MNHINFDYAIVDKTIDIIMKIGQDEYITKITLSYHDNNRFNQIIRIYERIKILLNSNNFLVKNFMFLFENSDFTIRYKFSNYNNNLNLSLFNGGMWLYGIDLVSKIPKNEGTVEIDNLSSMMFNLKI